MLAPSQTNFVVGGGVAPAIIVSAIMNKQFFQKVLPTQGNICVVGIKDGTVRPKFADDIDDAIQQMQGFVQGDWNAYFALGTFEGMSRKADACIFMRSFFVDIDCGPKKPYEHWDEGLTSLLNFVAEKELPDPIIVNSGHGIHAYWPFTEDVETDRWKPYAEAFKKLCLDSGLRIDESVTADAARVLRVPGSNNVKDPANPLPVQIIRDGEAHSFDDLIACFGPVELPFDISKVEKGLDDDTKAILEKRRGNFEYIFHNIAVSSLEGNGCAQIKFIIENPASCPEPLWYAGISVAVRCSDGAESIHLMSEGHPEYDRDATERKAQQSLSEANWAHGCDAFAKEDAARCSGCPFRGKITGPIELGKSLRVASVPAPEPVEEPTGSAETKDEAQSVRADTDTKKLVVFPDYLQPYSRGINGGIYYTPPPRRDKKGTIIQDPPEMITPNDVYPTQRVYSPHDGECLVMVLYLPLDATREFLLPLKDVASLERLKTVLATNGVTFELGFAPKLSSYLMKWAAYLVETQKADIMRVQQGWTEDYKSFVLGSTEYFANGTTAHCPPSPMAKNVIRNIKQGGTLDGWKKAAQMFNDPGYEWHAFTMLCGFASPLIEFTNVNGVILSLHGKSGFGKTGALYGGLSIWGHPENLAVFEATQNALMQRMITSKNILFGLDEQSNTDGKVVSHIAYNVSSGQSKLRMQSSTNQEREASYVTKLIAVTTTNTSLRDLMATYKDNTNAEEMRILEPRITRPSVPGYELTSQRGLQMFDALKTHHGHAGPMYIKELFRIGTTEIKRRLGAMYLEVGFQHTSNAEYRFLINLLATVRVADQVVKSLNLVHFDIERIMDVVGRELDRVIKGVVADEDRYEEVLGDFINKNIQSCLVVRDGKVTTEPRQALYVRAEVDEGTIWVSTSALKAYFKDVRIGLRDFENAIEKRGILRSKGRKQMAAGWKDAFGTTNVQAYEIKFDVSHLFADETAETRLAA